MTRTNSVRLFSSGDSRSTVGELAGEGDPRGRGLHRDLLRQESCQTFGLSRILCLTAGQYLGSLGLDHVREVTYLLAQSSFRVAVPSDCGA
jgi:hypothetical protein